MPQEIDTVLALVVLTGPSLVEVQVKPNERITASSLMEVMEAWRKLMNGNSGALYFIAPGELDWEVAALQTDFFGQEGERLKAVAVMVSSRVLNMVVNLYFSLFPAAFATRVVDDVEDGYSWLKEQGHPKA